MNRKDEERKTVEVMIRLYCRKKEKNRTLCDGCRELIEYAEKRLENCKFGENKPVCQNCTIHCYKKDMREKIREVMRFSGPRMIMYHPIMAIRHIIRSLLDRYFHQ